MSEDEVTSTPSDEAEDASEEDVNVDGLFEKEEVEEEKPPFYEDRWQYPLFFISLLLGIYVWGIYPLSLHEDRVVHAPGWYLDKARSEYVGALLRGLKTSTYERLKCREYYEYLWTTHPDYARKKMIKQDYLKMADVLFFLGMEKTKDLELAVALYEQINSDPKIELANDERLFIDYRLGHARYLLGENDMAVTAMGRYIEDAEKRNRERLRREKEGKGEAGPLQIPDQWRVLDENHRLAYFIMARALQHLGKDVRSLKMYDRFLDNDRIEEKTYEALERSGDVYRKLGRLSKAIERYEAALLLKKGRPETVLVHYKRGKAYYDQQKYLEAIQSFERVQGRRPYDQYNGRALYFKARALIALERYDEARRVISDLELTYPKTIESVAGQFAVAEIYRRMGNLDSATAQFKKTLVKNSTPLVLANPLVSARVVAQHLFKIAHVLKKKGDNLKAIDVFTFLVSNDKVRDIYAPDRLYFEIADCYRHEKEWVSAGNTCMKIVKELPESQYVMESMWAAGNYYLMANDYEDAYGAFKTFTDTYVDSPNIIEARYYRGICARKLGLLEDASESFERNEQDQKLNPYTYLSLYQLGETLIEQGKYDRAEKIFLENVFNIHNAADNRRFTPKSPIWRDSTIRLGEVYSRKKEYEKALQWFGEFKERYQLKQYAVAPEEASDFERKLYEEMKHRHFEVDYLSAMCLKAQGEIAEARALFAKLRNSKLPAFQRQIKYAMIYYGDTFYTEKRYQDAIAAYREAQNRYLQDAEGPYLGFQIANCYRNLAEEHKRKDLDKAKGFFKNASVEYEKAKWAYERIQPVAFKNKPEGFKRSYWQDILNWRQVQTEWAGQLAMD